MINSKYDKIGKGYNSTRQADPYLASRLYELLQPDRDKVYLDIGCGTGNYTVALANKGLTLHGIEPSGKMLDEAKKRSNKVKWIPGVAEKIPSTDKIFKGIIATLTIHHWKDLEKSFLELNRVLSENGRIVLFTSTPEQMKGYWLNHYFPEMLSNSIVQMPSLTKISNATACAGLEIAEIEKYFIKDDLQDHFLYVGKNRPWLYFNGKIRNGISSFSSIANIDEVKKGLEKLKSDLENNFFESIKQKYNNDFGDYCFITIKRQ